MACLHRMNEYGINAHASRAKWFDEVPGELRENNHAILPSIAVHSMPDGMPLPSAASASASPTGGIID